MTKIVRDKMNNKKKIPLIIEDKSLLIYKMGLASGIAWEVAKLVGSKHPYLAPLTVILSLQSTIDQSIRYSYHRIIGTVIGVSVTTAIASHLSVNGLTLGLLILGGTFIAKWLKLDETVLHQVALTILLVLSFEHKTGNYAVDRIRDTLIGAGVAVIIHMFIYPPNFTKQAIKSIDQFSQDLASLFHKVSLWVESGCDNKEGTTYKSEAKRLLQELHQIRKKLNKASNSLRLNPFGHKNHLILLRSNEKVTNLTEGYSYLSTVIPNFMDWTSKYSLTPVERVTWFNQLNIISDYYKEFAEENGSINDYTDTTYNMVHISNQLRGLLPDNIEKQRFRLAIYHDTIKFLENIKLLSKSKNNKKTNN